MTFRSTGYLAVRLRSAVRPPYTINNVEFPSFTFNGDAGALPERAALRLLDQTTGLPDIANPLFIQTPFTGSPTA